MYINKKRRKNKRKQKPKKQKQKRQQNKQKIKKNTRKKGRCIKMRVDICTSEARHISIWLRQTADDSKGGV